MTHIFLRIKVIERDHGSQQFLWRGSNREKTRSIRKGESYIGAKSSPCFATYIKNKNATPSANIYLHASKSIIHNSYKDDDLMNQQTEKVFKILIKQVIKINHVSKFRKARLGK
jgi:hypothetical protein